MANAREIQGRMKSIEDTRKITNAMYMISSTKLKKARKELENTVTYFYTLQATISRILRHVPDIEHRYFEKQNQVKPEEKKRGMIVITGDKGLAGAYNHNVVKLAQEWLAEGGENTLFVLGELGRQYFLSRDVKIERHFQYTVQNPTMHRARMISEMIMAKYNTDKLDEVWIVYTDTINGVQTEAKKVRLLPLRKENFKQANQILLDVHQEDFLMQPSPKLVIESIVPNYITGFIYGALVESFCSEQNARMTAMQAASDNANKMLHELSIAYNRVRQAAITQEITEVISGAKAQKKKKLQKKNKKKVG